MGCLGSPQKPNPRITSSTRRQCCVFLFFYPLFCDIAVAQLQDVIDIGLLFRKSQKTRQLTVQEINGVQSCISPPPLMAPKHCETSIWGAVIVPERGFLEPHDFPERRVVRLSLFAQL